MFRFILAATVAFAAQQAASGQATPVAFTNARLVTIAGDEIERGTLVVHAGRIVAVGAAARVSVPAGATVVDCAGKVIMPGLVDTHNHIGGVGGADGSGTLQPDVRVYDSINAMDSGFRRAVAGGLTTLNLMPGSGHLLSGQTVYVKLRPVKSIEEMMVRWPDGEPMGGIKMANGTNPMRDPPFAGTRGKAAAMVRDLFTRAQEYQARGGVVRGEKEAGATDGDGGPGAADDGAANAGGEPAGEPGGAPGKKKTLSRDLGMEALGEVLDGRRIVHHHTHRADDIMTVLRLREEFGFRVVLHHVSEAWKVADEIAAAGAPCSIILVDSPGGKLEASELSFETGAVLERAGVKVAFHTDDWITDSRLFLRMAALGVRAGMSRAGALAALTIRGAEMMDLQDRIGTLEAGKDADFVILSGDPFSVYTRIEQTWVEGVRVFDLTDEKDRLHAEGGFGAGRDQTPYFCCFDAESFVFGRSGTVWQAGGK
ncbi:MAG: amidohydrolase family protein [Phycisphaeraceae bacterium]|nr:amidohydrolase family protein [Phycisphaeraceae bacterium]MBX3407305.1 amidohydrolase family protein [Phycisphaeraceae bacterium]